MIGKKVYETHRKETPMPDENVFKQENGMLGLLRQIAHLFMKRGKWIKVKEAIGRKEILLFLTKLQTYKQTTTNNTEQEENIMTEVQMNKASPKISYFLGDIWSTGTRITNRFLPTNEAAAQQTNDSVPFSWCLVSKNKKQSRK